MFAVDYLSKSYRLDEQVIEAIETAKAGGTSANKFLRQLMGLDVVAPRLTSGPMGEIEERIIAEEREILSEPSPFDAIPVQQGFPCRCAHTGCQGAKFQGRTRFEKLCPQCSENGHSGDPRSCVECFNDQGPA